VALGLIAAVDGGAVDSVGAITVAIVADRRVSRCIVALDAHQGRSAPASIERFWILRRR
jgi:hypothetical protein